MINDDKLSYFERRITSELEAVEAQIKELEGERRALSRQLAKARSERSDLRHVTRKNSMNRVLAENSVLDKLKNSKQPVSTKNLYLNALSTNYDLKESTFRSYLHRMKKTGNVQNTGRAGWWKLTPPSD